MAFVYLFALYAYVQPVGYRGAYPTQTDRHRFATAFAGNTGLRLLYGQPHDVVAVGGYTAWRVGGVLAIAVGLFGVFASVRALRTEEDSGRTELVLTGTVSRASVVAAALAASVSGVAALWLAEFAGFLLGGVPAGGSAYLALATAAVGLVFVGVGALASQLASTGRGALEVGSSAFCLLLLLRILADTVPGAEWVRWLTPLGWAELLRPFAHPQPYVLVLPAAFAAAMCIVAVRVAVGRDIGVGLVSRGNRADPRTRLLSSPVAQALRDQRGALASWIGAVAVFSFLLGVIAHGISSSDLPARTRRQLLKIGAGSVETPTGYLAFLFLFLVLVLSTFACSRIADAARDETEQRLQTLLAQPVSRVAWLGGRAALAAISVVALALTAGVATWAGARTGGVHVGLGQLLEAALNAVPAAVLFLGIVTLAYALTSRGGVALGYAAVIIAFLWNVVGSLFSPPRWVLDLTPFAHVGLVPTQAVRGVAVAVMIVIGVVAAAVAIGVFRHRDVL